MGGHVRKRRCINTLCALGFAIASQWARLVQGIAKRNGISEAHDLAGNTAESLATASFHLKVLFYLEVLMTRLIRTLAASVIVAALIASPGISQPPPDPCAFCLMDQPACPQQWVVDDICNSQGCGQTGNCKEKQCFGADSVWYDHAIVCQGS
jgi:hypothetical protein